jgi:hypothetical protein
MNVLAKAKCSIGRHSGKWSHPDGRCKSSRTCDSCGQVETKELHVWGPFDYVAPDRCDQSHRCQRCRATEFRVRHEWGPWRYSNLEQNSPQERACKRCRETERTRYTLR